MLIDGSEKLDYRDGGAVKGALLDVLHSTPDDGTAERLVEFVRSHCPIDDQAHYNLYRYHQTRAANLATAIQNWDVALWQARRQYGENPPNRVWIWVEDVNRWQNALASLYETELRQMRESARQVEEAGDPALIERLNIARKLDPERPGVRPPSGHRHEPPADDESRLNQPAPSVTPDAADRAAPAEDPEPSVPGWSAPSPARGENPPPPEEFNPFDLGRDDRPRPGRDGSGRPTQPDLPGIGPAIPPPAEDGEGGGDEPGDDYPDEPAV
jgi:hypothetical protein